MRRAGRTLLLRYLGVRILLHFQLKLLVLLLLLGHRHKDFHLMNELLMDGIHETMLLLVSRTGAS